MTFTFPQYSYFAGSDNLLESKNDDDQNDNVYGGRLDDVIKHDCRVAEVVRRCKEPSPKSLDSDQNLKP